VKEANAGDERIDVGRPVHGVGEADAGGGSVGADDPSTEGSEYSDAVWAVGSSTEGEEGSCAFSNPRIPKRNDPTGDLFSPVAPILAQRASLLPKREMVSYALPGRPNR
jgi:hypothetical protein